MHGLARLGLVPENIPAGERHGRRGRFLRREGRLQTGGIGAEEGGAEERGVGAGAIVAAIGKRGDVEEREFRGRSAGNEAVGVDCPGRRRVVVGVYEAVHVAESRLRRCSGGGGRRNNEAGGGAVHDDSGVAIWEGSGGEAVNIFPGKNPVKGYSCFFRLCSFYF